MAKLVYYYGAMNSGKSIALMKDAYNLEEKGYNPVNQVVGYIMSGDPGYITSYKNARSKISEFDRSKLLEALLKEVLK